MVKRADIEVAVSPYLCLPNCPFFVGVVSLGDEVDDFKQVFCRAGCKENGTNSVVVRDVVLAGDICEQRIGDAQVEKLELAA